MPPPPGQPEGDQTPGPPSRLSRYVARMARAGLLVSPATVIGAGQMADGQPAAAPPRAIIKRLPTLPAPPEVTHPPGGKSLPSIGPARDSAPGPAPSGEGGDENERPSSPSPAPPIGQLPPGLPPPPALQGGSAVMTICGVVMYGLSIIAFQWEARRRDRRSGLERRCHRLEAKNDQLEAENRQLRDQIARNSSGIESIENRTAAVVATAGATDSKVDAIHKRLIERGFLNPAVPPRPPDPPRPNPTLLLVEDHQDTARLVADMFTGWGWAVTPVATIPEALEAINRGFHWIVLDLKLAVPGDGLQILRAIRERGIGSRVAVVTGASDPAIIAEARGLGPDVYLPKPVDIDKLRAAVRADLPLRVVGG